METYGTGLLLFHVFCDKKGIAEEHRTPAPTVLIQSFLSTIAGSYSKSALVNYSCAIRAWHLLHGLPWEISDDHVDLVLKASKKLAPESSERPKRRPYTIQYMEVILAKLDTTKPLDAAVAACLTTCFWTAARVGEFTVRTLTAFNTREHVKRSDVTVVQDRAGHKVTAFFIPRCETAIAQRANS